jgi:hypothetical protein
MKTIKLTDEEIQALEKIKSHNESAVKEFGLINIAQINLDNRKLRAEKFLSNVRDTEIDVAKSLEDKYGKGTVNLTTGEFNATNLK